MIKNSLMFLSMVSIARESKAQDPCLSLKKSQYVKTFWRTEEQELQEKRMWNLRGMSIQLKLSIHYLLSYDFVLHSIIYCTICMHEAVFLTLLLCGRSS